MRLHSSRCTAPRWCHESHTGNVDMALSEHQRPSLGPKNSRSTPPLSTHPSIGDTEHAKPAVIVSPEPMWRQTWGSGRSAITSVGRHTTPISQAWLMSTGLLAPPNLRRPLPTHSRSASASASATRLMTILSSANISSSRVTLGSHHSHTNA